MVDIIQNGKLTRAYEPSPESVILFAEEAETTSSPSLSTEGLPLSPQDPSVTIAVAGLEFDETSFKGVSLWLFDRALSTWHSPEEGVVEDLEARPGNVVFYVLADPILYERCYVQVTQNDGAGTISASILSR